MTKAEQRETRRAWNVALDAGRVVAFGDGLRMVAYPTDAMRDAEIAAAVAAGIPYRIAQAPKMRDNLTIY